MKPMSFGDYFRKKTRHDLYQWQADAASVMLHRMFDRNSPISGKTTLLKVLDDYVTEYGPAMESAMREEQ